LGGRKKLKFWSYTDQSSLWSGGSVLRVKDRGREEEKIQKKVRKERRGGIVKVERN
jgi:hypothetical protein